MARKLKKREQTIWVIDINLPLHSLILKKKFKTLDL